MVEFSPKFPIMDGRFSSNPLVSLQEEPGTTPDRAPGTAFHGGKTAAASSPKRSRRAVQKRVVSVPIGEGDGSKVKGEGAPPSDSWAWRKYGQKPIKGSPYPRGYYRCSSWKGCPARKQVERSRVDPSMLVVTYACDHNHPWPISKNPTNHHVSTATSPPPDLQPKPDQQTPFSDPTQVQPDHNFTDMETDAALLTDDFGWFSDVPSSPTKDTLLESPICSAADSAVASVIFPMREEDESLFADLGELPESSVVLRCHLREAPWCGSTG